jgi:hypothetical protein
MTAIALTIWAAVVVAIFGHCWERWTDETGSLPEDFDPVFEPLRIMVFASLWPVWLVAFLLLGAYHRVVGES